MFQVSESVSNHHQRWTKVNQIVSSQLFMGQKVSWSVVIFRSVFWCRSQIAIPAQGLIEFRDALTGLADFYSLISIDLLPNVAFMQI